MAVAMPRTSHGPNIKYTKSHQLVAHNLVSQATTLYQSATYQDSSILQALKDQTLHTIDNQLARIEERYALIQPTNLHTYDPFDSTIQESCEENFRKNKNTTKFNSCINNRENKQRENNTKRNKTNIQTDTANKKLTTLGQIEQKLKQLKQKLIS